MMQIAKPFYEGLRLRQLLVPWCADCGKPHFYPRSACPHCWSEHYEWRPAAGTGVIHSYTTVHANPPTAFAPRLPYRIAIIDLDEGVRLLSNVVGSADAIVIGDRVKVEFAEHDGTFLPQFRRIP